MSDTVSTSEVQTTETIGPLDIKQIQAILPHRYPSLLLDRVVQIDRRKRIVALKNVTINEPFFVGHFPGAPLMPGVLIVEAMAQAGATLLLNEIEDRDSKLVVFTGIERARFRRPVVPGDQLRIEVEVLVWKRIAGRKGGGVTTLGSHILLMAYSHVGHDSVIKDHAMLVNGATLAGHVTVEEWAVVGALSPVHQFVRIGAHAYIGGGTVITQDVLPFAKAVTPRHTQTYGLNAIGLERRGFSKERIRKIHHAFRVLLNSKLNTSQALEKLHAEGEQGEDVEMLLRFIAESKRGVIK